jgi:hypothetical protein
MGGVGTWSPTVMVWSGDQDHGCEAVAADSLRIQTEADRMEGLIQQDAGLGSSSTTTRGAQFTKCFHPSPPPP